MHKTGARRDLRISVNETGEGQAVRELLQLDARRADLAELVPQADNVAAAAFRQAEPVATCELAKRQERESVARELLGKDL